MLWIKALHLFFVISWFAGLFYLPRILVNLAMENDAAAHARLITMARKLYRFMTILAVFALAFGLWLWLAYFYQGLGSGWLNAKRHYDQKPFRSHSSHQTNTVQARLPR